MNAPERTTLDKPMPLIIALVGAPGSGRGDVDQMLTRQHGFAVASFEQPLREAILPLYGVTPGDLLFDAARRPLQRWDKSPAQLIDALRAHSEELVGPDFLTRRLLDRTVARGEWGQQDLVITDLKTIAELRWLRLVGGTPLWIRRPTGPLLLDRELDPAMRMALTEWTAGDLSLLNEGSVDTLTFMVDSLIERARRAAALVP